MRTLFSQTFTELETKALLEIPQLADFEKGPFVLGSAEFSDRPSDIRLFAKKLFDAQILVKTNLVRVGGEWKEIPSRAWNGTCLKGDNYDEAMRLAKLPEPTNQVEEFKKWFLSKKWSLPLYLIFWGVPFLAGWALAIAKLVQWLSPAP